LKKSGNAMKKTALIYLMMILAAAANAQVAITPADVTNFQNGIQNANENDIYFEAISKQYYIGLSGGRLKFLQDSIKVNATLTGAGTTTSPLGLAQQGALTGQVLKWNGTTWTPGNEAAALNWLITGNSNITYNTHFLGTLTDVPLTLRSNNTPMLEVGRRQSLGLLDASGTGLFPYNQPNASVTYVRGAGGVSALQFEANGASFYKPIFFTDADGNFVMRGSSAGTDFFEMGSGGATGNNGRFNFVIGDDGDEPIIFSKYNYNPVSAVEMMRLQGTGLNNEVRVGINTAGTTANSTFQVTGSVSKSIVTTAANLTLNATHYTVILTTNATITLPAANTCTGRIYIIKKTVNGNASISTYMDNSGAASTTIQRNVYQLQSDGTNWQKIN
jgi:hypothetical protein